MTTYYIDPDLGSDSTGDGTIGNPYRKAPSQSGAAVPNVLGNTYKIKRGTIMSEGIQASYTGNATSEAQRTIYTDYGDADRPPTIDVVGASAYGIRISNKDYVSVSNFDLKNTTNTGLQVINNATRACNYFRAYKVRAYNCAVDGVSMAHATDSTGPSPSAAVGVIFDSCEGHKNGQHGVGIAAYASNLILQNCYSTGNSLTSSGWGVYQGGFCQTYLGTSGWTINGNVKSRTSITGTKPYSVESDNTLGVAYFLVENGGTPTTPAAGEWGYSAGTIYVNIGVVTSGYAINVTFQPNTNALIQDSRGDSHVLFDGVGVGLDRGVFGGRILRCQGYNNAGSAIQMHLAQNVHVSGAVGFGNRETVGVYNVGGSCTVSHVSSRNQSYGINIARLFTGSTLTVTNNLSKDTTAISASEITGTLTANYNAYTGSLVGVSAGANDIITNIKTNLQLVPMVDSSVIHSGVFIPNIRDNSKVLRYNPPTIGAYEYVAERADAGTRGVR